MPMTHTAGVMACVIYRLTGSASMRDGVRDLWADRLCQHVLAHVPEGQALRHDAAFLGCACGIIFFYVGASATNYLIRGFASTLLVSSQRCFSSIHSVKSLRASLEASESVITNSRCPLTQVECRWLALHDLEHSSCDIQKGETNLLEGECDAAEACSVLACHIGAGRWALFCERVSSELASGLKAGG
eukprot:scaffold231142_cov39-Tisochrysis_lutea.AAC.4